MMEPRMAPGWPNSKGLPITLVCFPPEALVLRWLTWSEPPQCPWYRTHCLECTLTFSAHQYLLPSWSHQNSSAPLRSSSEAFPSIALSHCSSLDYSPSSSNVLSALPLLGTLVTFCLCSLLMRQAGKDQRWIWCRAQAHLCPFVSVNEELGIF